MLLEEVLLHLLRGTGYRTVDTHIGDETLANGPAGLEVLGRGGKHQIDAIADFRVSHPFSHRQRLLVEAKCFAAGTTVGIEVVRNAVGVLKDVNEYWVTGPGHCIPKSRYHYQYALFSATAYSDAAQRYAFAHDVYLIPVEKSSYLASTISAIRNIGPNDFGVSNRRNIPISVSELRRAVREALRSSQEPLFPSPYPRFINKLANVLREARRINYALLAVLGGSFPIFLVPSTEAVQAWQLPEVIDVRIRWDNTGWYLYALDGQQLYSFDLPKELFELYAEAGVLSPERALDLKEERMHEFYAFQTLGDQVRVIRFELDMPWLETIRARTRVTQ